MKLLAQTIAVAAVLFGAAAFGTLLVHLLSLVLR